MVSQGRGVTIRLILLVWLGVTAIAYGVLHLWTEQGGALPPATWGAFIVLVFMACGVFFAGLPVRRFLEGQAKKPLNPMRAMRTVVLAQASALTGALVTGWYLAQILVLWPDLDISSRRSLAGMLAALAFGGVLMVVAGLVVQAMCRVGGDHDDEGKRDRDLGSGVDRDHEEEPRGGSHER